MTPHFRSPLLQRAASFPIPHFTCPYMKRSLRLLAASTGLIAAVACSNDETPLPPYTEELACIHTDLLGRATTMERDNGASQTVSNEVKGLKNDTTYRVLALFTESEDRKSVHLTDFAPIMAPETLRFRSVKQDPLHLVACWRSGNFVNFRIQVKGTNGTAHYFGFHRDEIRQRADGGRTLPIRLYHDQNKDPLYYTRETYISLPLLPFSDELSRGRDSISVTIATFKGSFTSSFAY